MDHLNLQKVHVYAVSGGGPGGFTFLLRKSSRVSSFVACAPFGPIFSMKKDGEKVEYGALSGILKLSEIHEKLGEAAAWLFRQMYVHFPLKFLLNALSDYMPEDQKVAIEKHAEFFGFMIDFFGESLRQGSRHLFYELILFTKDWDVNFQEKISGVPMKIIQGEKDVNIPPEHSKYLCKKIPGISCEFFPEKTHQMCIEDWDKIFNWMHDQTK